ncbi:MAG: type pilus assembly protein PilM [Candidatus Binatota bacterium]|nr:type pilus assembly protein PilM [Candidatus Binatota bacterium]
MSALSNILNLRVTNLFRTDGRLLSLDIGSSAVKLLEIDGPADRPRIRAFGSHPLAPSAVQNNMIQEPDQVAAVIRTLVAESGAKAKQVITAVPGPAVIIKKIQLPHQEPGELENSVLFEAGNFIPENLENVNLDFQIVDVIERDNQVEVLLVAVKKEIINSYTSAIRMAGLEPAVVDVDYFALENMFEANYSPPGNEIVALVNIGARYSSINILRGSRSTFTGDVPVGGKEFNDTLVRNLGVSYVEAETIKLGGTSDHPLAEIDPLLQPVKEFIADEIHRALSFFWTAATDETISAVYVSGGAAHVPGLVTLLHERLEMPVQLASPFERVDVSVRDREGLMKDAPSYAIAVGLATRRPGDK